jgi:MFS family permease
MLVGAASLALAAWTMRHAEPPAADPGSETSAPLRALARNRPIALGTWLIILEAATIGATGTLLPLRLARFGASGVLIGATFLVASLISTQVAGPIGRTVDRRGAGRPLYVGLMLTAVLLAVLPLPGSAVPLAIVSMIVLGGPLTAYTIPAMSVITDASERAGIPLVLATLMLNLAWATGEVVGAPVAANLSAATSDAVPLLGLSALMVLTLPVVIRARLTRAPADGEPAPASQATTVPHPTRSRAGDRTRRRGRVRTPSR